uniref:Protein kinase domain-containing protein n=1 Tax=Musa acuminata subsp. malaccensis TaxID=214687 RepID=A0A804JD41_MUSAM|nr:PREDICTED: putative cysteine-rich receptor-like protein kinase 35 isoform X2 [Musa acuminata subsp. malaccensis]
MATRPKKFWESLIKPFIGGRNKEEKGEEDLEAIAATEHKVFRYEMLVAATRNFNPKQKLGEGGFGPVFKGRLEDGRDVAVKRLGRGSRQGAREFENEAMLLSRVQHKNVVNLYGYCAHDDDKLLVYEYIPNESLDKLLFSGEDEGNGSQMQLDWKRRYQVIVGVARGLLYLHEGAHTAIIHRDIKASNILLDNRWVPKIADFGMARLFPEDQTHVNTRVAGTNGYMAPEYVMHGSLSTKADVFSFGVLVLELISGRKNSAFSPLPDPEANSLLEWAWKLYKKGQRLELLDPAVASTADAEQVAMCVQIGLLCTQSDPKLRPDMKRVVIILSKQPSVLEEPTRPGIPGSRYRRRSYGTRGSHYSAGESSSTINSASTAATTATTSTTLTMHQESHQEQHPNPT